MEKKWQELYQDLGMISVSYSIYRKRDNVVEIKKIIPQIQEFVLWFLEENRLNVETELYQAMSQNLLEILQDILDALKYEDKVLLNDAVTYGLIEYLELFTVKSEEECADDSI